MICTAHASGAETATTTNGTDQTDVTAPHTAEARHDVQDWMIDALIMQKWNRGDYEQDRVAEFWTLEKCLADTTLRHEAMLQIKRKEGEK